MSPNDLVPEGWAIPSLSPADAVAACASLNVLRELAATIRRIDSNPFVAGQFSSEQLMRVVRKNYPDLVDVPNPPSTPIDLKQVTEAELKELNALPRPARRAAAREVRDAVAKATGCGALRATPLARIQHCAPLFAVWQRVKWRLIYDLRIFNTLSIDPSFTMETVADVPTIARGCRVGGKIDLKSAYWQIPLGPGLQAFMGCWVEEISMTWRTLPFGLAMAPRLFTGILRPLLVAWRSRGIRVLVYLDDIAVFAPDTDTYAKHMAIVIRDLQESGIRIAADKAFLIPHTQFELLGIMVDVEGQAFSISQERANQIANEARDILMATTAPSALDCTALLGRMAFASLACPWLTYFRASFVADTAAACPGGFNPHARVALSSDAKSELAWWANKSPAVMTRHWRWATICTTSVYARRGATTPIPTFEAASDASDNGVGLRFGPRGAAVAAEPLPDWLPPTSPSAAREIYGLARLVEVGGFPAKSTVRLIVDAQAAVGTWTGPSVTPLTARAARRLFSAVAASDINVIIDWLPREELFDVDAGSREAASDMAHSMVPDAWLRKVLNEISPGAVPDVELFASSHNRAFPQIPCGSRRPDPSAQLGDGVSSRAWTTARLGWAFPPFGLSRVVINRIQSLDRTPSVLVLLPSSPLLKGLRGFRFSPGPSHLLAPPDFKRLVASPRPLTLCIPIAARSPAPSHPPTPCTPP